MCFYSLVCFSFEWISSDEVELNMDFFYKVDLIKKATQWIEKN